MSAKDTIEAAWEGRAALNAANAPKALRAAVEEALAGLDAGKLRVAEKVGGQWITHQWLKKAVLLSFRLEDNRVIDGGGIAGHVTTANPIVPARKYSALMLWASKFMRYAASRFSTNASWMTAGRFAARPGGAHPA